MRATLRKIAFRLYRLINLVPFNNKKKGKVAIENDGALLFRCRIKSSGVGNRLIFHAGGGI